jgi:hypothetical protein
MWRAIDLIGVGIANVSGRGILMLTRDVGLCAIWRSSTFVRREAIWKTSDDEGNPMYGCTGFCNELQLMSQQRWSRVAGADVPRTLALNCRQRNPGSPGDGNLRGPHLFAPRGAEYFLLRHGRNRNEAAADGSPRHCTQPFGLAAARRRGRGGLQERARSHDHCGRSLRRCGCSYQHDLCVPKTQIRMYWWCSPPTSARDTMRPTR